MHPYVTDSDERIRVSLWLTFMSLLASWGLHLFLTAIQLTPHWLIDVPSFAGFYYIFYALFDKRVWKLPILQKIGLIKIPYLAGKWNGYLVSSFDEHKTEIRATIEIKQTWTELLITLETETSISRSETASIITKIPDLTMVSYEYMNEPKSHAISGMQIHRGMAKHEYQLSGNHEDFDGEYFTGRGRGTFGALYFKRKSR